MFSQGCGVMKIKWLNNYLEVILRNTLLALLKNFLSSASSKTKVFS